MTDADPRIRDHIEREIREMLQRARDAGLTDMIVILEEALAKAKNPKINPPQN